MANLHLRGVDEVLVRKLHQRAKAHGRSAAEEHRQILRSALLGAASEGGFHEMAARLRERIAARGGPAGPLAEDLIREDRDNDEPYR
jgi:plasmid stability protein